MKITPLEIRQRDFEKKLRGYDKDEVNAFLKSLSNEWERVLEENKELNIKLQQSEKEVSKLREVESSLFKTLKTAEDTGAKVIDQANKAAELHMKETQMNAEALLNESKNKSRGMIEKAELEVRQIMEELQEAVKKIQQNHQDIQNHRDLALQELKNLSITLIEKVERNAKESKEFKLDDYVQRVRRLARESEERIKAEKTEIEIKSEPIERPLSEAKENTKPKENLKKEVKKSIDRSFDDKNQSNTIASQSKMTNKPDHSIEPVTIEKLTNTEATTKQPKETSKTPSPESSVADEERKLEVNPKLLQEERKKRRTAQTISFFDELDTDN